MLSSEKIERIVRSLDTPINAVHYTTASDGLKVIAFKAMIEGIDNLPTEQLQLLAEFNLISHINYVIGLMQYYSVISFENIGDNLDPLNLMITCLHEQRLASKDILECIKSCITREINVFLPSLQSYATYAYINRILNEKCKNTSMDVIADYGEQSSILTPLQIAAIDSEVNQKLSQFKIENCDNSINQMMVLAIVNRRKWILAIKNLSFAIGPDIKLIIKHILRKSKHIDISSELLEQFKDDIATSQLISSPKDFQSRIYNGIRFHYTELAEFYWQNASIEEQKSLSIDNKYFTDAVLVGELPTLQLLWQISSPEQRNDMLSNEDYMAFPDAAARRHLHVIQWFWQIASPIQQNAMLASNGYMAFIVAAEIGSFQILEWLWEITNPEQQNAMLLADGCRAFNIASIRGKFHVLRWLWQHASYKIREQMLIASHYKAFTRRVEVGEILNSDIAEIELLHILQWLWQNANYKIQQAMLTADSFYAFRMAASNGQLEILQWLMQMASTEHANAMLIANNYDAFTWALRCNRFHAVQWLWSQYSPDQQLCLEAYCENKKINLVKFQLTRKDLQFSESQHLSLL